MASITAKANPVWISASIALPWPRYMRGPTKGVNDDRGKYFVRYEAETPGRKFDLNR